MYLNCQFGAAVQNCVCLSVCQECVCVQMGMFVGMSGVCVCRWVCLSVCQECVGADGYVNACVNCTTCS